MAPPRRANAIVSSRHDRIGFAIRDARGRSAAFTLEESDRQALVFGSASPVRIEGEGILPAHFVVLPTEEGLVAATAGPHAPALLNGQPLPAGWTYVEIPSRIRVGDAVVDFFTVRESGVRLVDHDVETTVCTRGDRGAVAPQAAPAPPPPISSADALRPLPPRPPASLAGPTPPPPALEAWTRRATELWEATPRSSRVLLGVVGVLLFVMAVR
ncbi:MAG: hypothetical protein JST00_42700 [Deltaproteobacteria bacterium]|nr:hypothetical protein [Deltaproteobacteria bacterium]